MKFKDYFTEVYESIIILEDDSLSGNKPDGDSLSGSDTPEDSNDLLDPDQESALGDTETFDEDGAKFVDMTNLLLNSLRFKPSDEFKAYLKMPRFHNLSAVDKLITIRNVLSDHPEKIIKEADEATDTPAEFGDVNLGKLTEADEMDLLRLIIRAIKVNPYAMDITLRELPSEATPENYMNIIETIEGVLF